jgi:hypothetical protein
MQNTRREAENDITMQSWYGYCGASDRHRLVNPYCLLSVIPTWRPCKMHQCHLLKGREMCSDILATHTKLMGATQNLHNCCVRGIFYFRNYKHGGDAILRDQCLRNINYRKYCILTDWQLSHLLIVSRSTWNHLKESRVHQFFPERLA